MRWIRPYSVFCLVVLILFTLAKYTGWSMADDTQTPSRGSSGGSGGGYYAGTSSGGGGGHK